MCKGSQKTTSTSSSSPDPQAYNLYSQLLTRAQGVANTPYTPYSGQLVAPINAQQNTGIAGINSSAGFAVPYIQQALQQVTNSSQPLSPEEISQYFDPWQNAVTNATINQMTNLNNQQLAQIKGNAVAQGALGGNREAIAQAATAGQQTAAEAPIIAGINSQGYQNAVNTAMQQKNLGISGAYGMGSLGVAGENAGLTGANAQVGAGTLQQQNQQMQDAAQYQQFLQALAYPFQTTQWLAGVGTGVGSQMGGSSTGTTTGPAPSPFSQILGGGLGITSMLGMSGAFGSAGWLMPAMAALARGGRVKGYADGGVAGDSDFDLAESPETLDLQQQSLIAGQRPAQMFPVDGTELPVPDGMQRLATSDGVFHYNPKMISGDEISSLSGAGRQNEFLGLGPFSKDQIFKRIQSGEEPVIVVERARNGTEIRAAIGTMNTAPAQIAAMERNKMPGSTIRVENPMQVISERAQRGMPNTGVIGRDMGGPIPDGGGVAGMPYASAQGWIPGINITRGNPFPPLPKGGAGSQQQDPIKEGMQLGNLAKQIAGGFPSMGTGTTGVGPSYGGDLNLDTPSYWGGGVEGVTSGYRRGGTVNGYADGGGPDFDSEFGAFDPQPNGVLPSNIMGVPTAAMGQTEGFAPTPVDATVIPPDQVPMPRSRPDVPASPAPEPTGVAGGDDYAYEPPEPSRQSLAQDAIYYANQYGVPPELYLRLLHQESGLNPNVHNSSAGAIGVAQLMPGTAKDLGVNPYDTSENLKGGAQYLRQMYDKFGNWNDAVRAYNAGPDRVNSWLAGKGGLPAETVAYHRNIMGGGSPSGPSSGVVGLPPGSSYSDMQTQRGVAPEDRFGANSNLWPALAAAGFGMMASQSPFPGVAIGQGALTGMQTAASLQKAQQEQALKRSEVNLKVQEMAQQADRWQRDYALKMLPYEGGLTAKDRAELGLRAAAINETKRQPVKYVRSNGSEGMLIPRKDANGAVQWYDYDPETRKMSSAPVGGGDWAPVQEGFGNQAPGGEQPPTAPGGARPIQVAATDGIIPQNNAQVKAGNYDYSQNGPYIEKGMDVPEPQAVAGHSVQSIKTDAEYYLQTGKLPPTRSGRSPIAIQQQNYRNAVQNYGNAMAASRDLKPEQIADMWRSSPGMLRFILGADGRATVSLGTAVRHLDTLAEYAKAWKDAQLTGNVQTLNRIQAAISREFGGTAATNLETVAHIVGPEIVKAIGVAGAGTADDRKTLSDQFTTARSFDQVMGAVTATQKLMGGQLEGKRNQAMNSGVPPEKFKSLIGDRPYELLTQIDKGINPYTTAPGQNPLKGGTQPPMRVIQNGWIYEKQPDGSMKAIAKAPQ